MADGAEQPTQPTSRTTDGPLDQAMALVTFLREHCPWDQKQTPESLIQYLIEESHEVAEAIRGGIPSEVEDELGDLLLNLAFQLVIGEEQGVFDRTSVLLGLREKIERRHPSLFGRDSKESWNDIKNRERRETHPAAQSQPRSVLDHLPTILPPIRRAYKIQERVSRVGFDWNDPSGGLAKVREETEEVADALADSPAGLPSNHLKEEIGDLLFSVVNLARLAKVDPSDALAAANAKFVGRFQALEVLAQESNVPLPGATLPELDVLWEQVKARRQAPG